MKQVTIEVGVVLSFAQCHSREELHGSVDVLHARVLKLSNRHKFSRCDMRSCNMMCIFIHVYGAEAYALNKEA